MNVVTEQKFGLAAWRQVKMERDELKIINAELLEACKACLPLLQMWVQERPWVNQLDNVAVDVAAAIAKAEGK